MKSALSIKFYGKFEPEWKGVSVREERQAETVIDRQEDALKKKCYIVQHVLTSSSLGIKFRNLSALFQSLGLPVTIAHAGLVPFLVSFLVGFFVQVSNTWP